MTPDQVSAFVTQWGGLALTIYASLVAICSLAIKVIASYIRSVQEQTPDYKPGKLLIKAIALIQAIALNSPAAANIVASAKDNTAK